MATFKRQTDKLNDILKIMAGLPEHDRPWVLRAVEQWIREQEREREEYDRLRAELRNAG